MDKKQILARIALVTNELHKLESEVYCLYDDDTLTNSINVMEDILYDVKTQLENELFSNEKEENV